jgi:hypothetical protein
VRRRAQDTLDAEGLELSSVGENDQRKRIHTNREAEIPSHRARGRRSGDAPFPVSGIVAGDG